jgi:tetrahydromethanopterin S-methyltransferase subunit C
MAVKESNALGNVLGRSIFAVGVVMSLLGLIFSNLFPVIFGLGLTVGGVLVVMLLQETKMMLKCPKCQPAVKPRKMLKAR